MKMIEVKVSDEIKEKATAYIEKNYGGFARRGTFDGSRYQRVMGHVGYLVIKEYLKVPNLKTDIIVDGKPDKYDFSFNGKSIDVKTTYSFIYRNTGKIPRDWGFLVPDSQVTHMIHDYYIWVVVDGMRAETINKCGLHRACGGEAVRDAEVIWGRKYEVPTRVVTYDKTFPIEELLAGFTLDAWF